MKRIPGLSFLLILFASTLSLQAQVLNIESARMQSDTTGWMGNANASFASGQAVDHTLGINIGAHL